jgi:hypothetical protein
MLRCSGRRRFAVAAQRSIERGGRREKGSGERASASFQEYSHGVGADGEIPCGAGHMRAVETAVLRDRTVTSMRRRPMPWPKRSEHRVEEV